MAGYLLGALGIVVSVALFLIGYRQTVGAKKERIAAANAQLERTLIRRVVLEKHTPLQVDLTRLIEGKARDHRILPADLLSEGQLLNTIYTRVTESDLIPAEQREEILRRIAPAFSAFENAQLRDKSIDEAVGSAPAGRSAEWVAIMLAVLAALAGGLVSILPAVRYLEEGPGVPLLLGRLREVLPMLTTTVAVSLGVITVTYLFFRLLSSQEETPSKRTEVSSHIVLEAEVRRLLEEAGFEVQASGPQSRGFDFVAERGGKRLLVEVKNWSRTVPPQFVSHVVQRLRSSAKTGDGDAFLVTRSPIRTPRDEGSTQGVSVVSLEEFRSLIKRHAG